MNTHSMPTPAAAPASPAPPQLLSDASAYTPTTRVLLAYVEQRINLYLRFGHPVREQRLDRQRRIAWFTPTAVFCRIRWEANDYGTTRWQLMVLQAGAVLDAVQRIPGIAPGASLLLRAEGERQVQPVLQLIDGIEARGIDPAAVSPAYWRTLCNRLAARMPLPIYTAERHAAHLAGAVFR
ncbi:MAG: transposase [Hydrocarboniphaga sp.]|uniref:DUF2840 domain-containing protein n=1 Tax=Hydrocarboniphaga sp. TaxID=2033016 RepID=UPI00262C09FB|nr:DUF2840 domain-containing protein [Hydrocarboniphaga sp.]MDB5971131.1 transposase [Hydrocarboniphaga sp.]